MKNILLFLFLFLTSIAYSQPPGEVEYIPSEPPKVIGYASDFYILEYWGQKGIASDSLVDILRSENQEIKNSFDFTTSLLGNCRTQKADYQEKLSIAAGLNHTMQKNLLTCEGEADKWKKKAKKRGATIAVMSGLFAAGLGAIAVVGL